MKRWLCSAVANVVSSYVNTNHDLPCRETCTAGRNLLSLVVVGVDENGNALLPILEALVYITSYSS